MQDLKALREKYKTTLHLANMNLDEGDSYSRNSREGAKNKAKFELPAIKQQLVSQILKDSLTIIGLNDVDLTRQSKDVASGNDNVIALDFNNVAVALTNTVFTGNGPYSFNTESIGRLNNLIASMGHEFGALYMPLIKINASKFKVFSTKEQIFNKVLETLNETYGTDLAEQYLRFQLENVISTKAEFDKLVLILTNVPQEALSLMAFTDRCVVVTDKSVPNSIGSEESKTASELMENVSKLLNTSKKGAATKKTKA